jgi:hypothetical protein
MTVASLLAIGGPQAQAAAPTTIEVTVSTAGVDANRASRLDAVTPDGRYVLFDSTATNLVAHDTNGVRDVFVRDTVAHRTFRVSVGPGGRQANGPSWGGSISASGQYITFQSDASNLTLHPDTNGVADAFLRIRTGTPFRTVRVSITPSGGQFLHGVNGLWTGARPSEGAGLPVSANGRYVLFGVLGPPSSNREWTYLRDRRTRATMRVFRQQRFPVPIAMSASGRYLVVQNPDDTGNVDSFLVRDRGRGTVVQVPFDVASLPINSLSSFAASPDAQHYAFSGFDGGAGIDDAYRWQYGAGGFDPVTPFGPGANTDVSGISASGRYIGAGGARWDMQTSALLPAALDASGGSVPIVSALLSANAEWFVFSAPGRHVTPTDGDRSADLFIRGPLPLP